MPVKYPSITKIQAYQLVKQFPSQSQRVSDAVKRLLYSWRGEWNFDAFMRTLFFSKDILLRTGYYHFNTQIKKHITT